MGHPLEPSSLQASGTNVLDCPESKLYTWIKIRKNNEKDE